METMDGAGKTNTKGQREPSGGAIDKDPLTIQTSITDETALTEQLSGLSFPPETPKKFDIDDITKKWSPKELRDKRTSSEKSKVQGRGGNNPLIGGDHICNGRGEALTLSFCFEGPENSLHAGKKLGLTCGHLGYKLGESLYVFSTNIADSKNRRPMKKVGTIVDMSYETDSLIVEFDPHVTVELYTMRTSRDTKHTVDLSETAKASTAPEFGTELVGFGAQRRGTHGKVSSVWSSACHEDLRKHDVGVESFDEEEKERDGKKAVSHDGDCGMIYVDENGVARLMHHAITGNAKGFYTSWGISLQRVMTKHAEYFGITLPVCHDVSRLQIASPQGYALQPPRFEVVFAPGEEPEGDPVVLGKGYTAFDVLFAPGEEPDLEEDPMV